MTSSQPAASGLEQSLEIECRLLDNTKLNPVAEMTEGFDRQLEEVMSIMKKHKAIHKDKKKMLEDIKKLDEGIEKAKKSIEDCLAKSAKLEKKNQDKQKSLEVEKQKQDAAKDVWNMLGLSIIPLENSKQLPISEAGKRGYEGDYLIEFTKIDPQNPSKKFSTKVSLTASTVKIVETIPRDILSISDLDRIEEKAAESHDGVTGVDFRLLVCLLRKNILTKVSK